MNNKYIRYCIIEPQCRLRIAIFLFLTAGMLFQGWYGKAQIKRLNVLEIERDLIARTGEMEKTLRVKEQLEAFQMEEKDGLKNVHFTKINGVAMHKGEPAVLINGTVHREGSKLEEYVIIKITEKLITLKNQKTGAIKNLYVFDQ